MTDLVERVARLLDPLAWDVDDEDELPRLFRTTLEGRRDKARRDATAAIAEVRAADVERGPSQKEISSAIDASWDARGIEGIEAIIQAAARVRMEEVE